MTSQVEDSARLQDLLSAFHAGRASRGETHSAVLDLILGRIRCPRVSMWKLVAGEDDLSLLCFASKTAGGAFDTSDRRLQRAQYHDYFDALIESGTRVSADALADPTLRAIGASYLLPNNIVSMLGAAFLLNSRAYGMVCCEEATRQREWPASDVVALRAIVNKLALLMWSAPESVLPTTPSLPLHASAPKAEPAGRRR
jgi:GAF domain-containing protein